ncbi:TRZ/ATZ family hydrolase [Candidatus Thiosymbion oneisti]|uniref:TRZ/ATZ family hydrolase n=1 Tax=Candidatus Thiosymbion oneisti TaxID=589554 RepID=UPI000A79250A|nr:TRZ/ATZ family hydrolase [Candidatus Thiosymbion oneisti]
MQAELLLHPQWIVPVDAAASILTDHSLAVSGGRIRALLPTAEARAHIRAAQEIELPGHVLIPGLINAHTHSPMVLLRGLADDLPLMTWLNQHIWPAEQRWAEPEFVRAGTRLAALEMLKSGTICFNDMYFFAEVTAKAAADIGMRAVAGMILVDFPTRFAETPEEYLRKGLALHDRYRDHALICTAFAPHAPYSVSDGPFERIRTLSNELDVPVHIHLHETHDEVVQSLRDHGERPLARLERLGLLGPNLVAVHMTQLEAAEIAAVAHANAHVVHCPESNLKLAAGFCPAARLLAAGVNVALGTDGAASNNDLDMMGELRTAALLGKGVADSPAALPAYTALRMATLNGARALGIDAETGSLETGKSADMVALDLRDPDTQPVYNPVSQVVYAAGRDQVQQVWVAGRHLIRDGEPTTLDPAAILDEARVWGARIAASQ